MTLNLINNCTYLDRLVFKTFFFCSADFGMIQSLDFNVAILVVVVVVVVVVNGDDFGCSENLCFRSPVGFLLVMWPGITGGFFFVRIIFAFLKPSLLSSFIWFQTCVSTNRFSCGLRMRVFTKVFLFTVRWLTMTRLDTSEFGMSCSCSICSTRQ